MGMVYNANMHIIYNVRGMRHWPFTFTLIFRSGYMPRNATVKASDKPPPPFASASLTRPFIQPPAINVSFLSFLLCCPPFLPVSLWSKQVPFSLDVRVSVTLNCRLLSYTTPTERHPTMTIILCSDGCSLCLGTEEEHLRKPLFLLKWRAQRQHKANRLNFRFGSFPLHQGFSKPGPQFASGSQSRVRVRAHTLCYEGLPYVMMCNTLIIFKYIFDWSLKSQWCWIYSAAGDHAQGSRPKVNMVSMWLFSLLLTLVSWRCRMYLVFPRIRFLLV